jgi:DNA-binding SARP family transcriptional activator
MAEPAWRCAGAPMAIRSSSCSFPWQDIVYEPSDGVAARLQEAENLVAAARQGGEPAALAEALVGLARLRYRLGQYKTAQALADEALAVAEAGSPARADAWQVLANCAADIESLAQAEAYYRLAADLARETGHHRAHVAALHGLAAGVYFLRGCFDLALAADSEARRIAAEQGRPDWLVYPLVTIALVHQSIGQREQAQAALAELAPLAPTGSAIQGYHLCLSGALALDDGRLETGRAFFMQARPIAEASGEPWLNGAVRLGLSRYYRLLGDGPNARAWADDALAFARRLGCRHDQGRALSERGRAAWLCGDLLAAEADLRAAIAVLSPLEAAFDLARTRFWLAALLHSQQRFEADAVWREAACAIVRHGYAFLLEQERALAFPLVAAYLKHADPEIRELSATLLTHLARVPPPALRICILGRFQVWQGNRLIESRAWSCRRAGELFRLLLISPRRSLSFDQVAEALWPDKTADAALIAFHHATSALRHALEPDLPDKFPSRYLAVEEGQIALMLPPGSWLDSEAFEAHCRRGEWEEALALYGGELLPEHRYADWTVLHRERLALLYQQALLGAAEVRLAAGRPAEALDACRRLLAIEPWQEKAVLLGMRACVALGDVTGARRLYHTLAQTLRAELNTAPQAELQAYYRELTPPNS